MNIISALLIFGFITFSLSAKLSEINDRNLLFRITFIAWVCQLMLLIIVNSHFQFTGGGDDFDYFMMSAQEFNSISELMNPSRFSGSFEQPGYPLLLTIISSLFNQDIIALKLMNIGLFISLIPIWYRIGIIIESRQFGRAMSVVTFFLTPLWYYGFFLLKDISITFLQSVFILCVITINSKGNGKGYAWFYLVISTFALIPFRSQLVLVNIAVIIVSSLLMSIRQGTNKRSFFVLVFSAIIVVTLYKYSSDSQMMAMIGISDQSRVIGSEAFRGSLVTTGMDSAIQRPLFPILYVFSETSGFSLKTWSNLDAPGLRGVLAVPWIIVGVPFFLIGLRCILRSNLQLNTIHRGLISRLVSTRIIATPWGVVLIFLLIYMVLSWKVGDTTRWRLPDMPAMAAVALAGWNDVSIENRKRILIWWTWLILSSFVFFILIRSL